MTIVGTALEGLTASCRDESPNGTYRTGSVKLEVTARMLKVAIQSVAVQSLSSR